MDRITVIGAGGYVCCRLTTNLLARGYQVNALDIYIYGNDVFGEFGNHPNLNIIKGDIRDKEKLKIALVDASKVIHLACISNDPSFDLDPALSKSINLDSFDLFLSSLEESNVNRLIFASSSSVYGVSDITNVVEETEKLPLTDYAKYKLMCEDKLIQWNNPKNVDWVAARPATICGYSNRLRLDLTVNILTASAMFNNKIKVFGGSQYRCSLDIRDCIRAYLLLLEEDSHKINHKIFNVGNENCTVMEIANKVKMAIGKPDLSIEVTESNDSRSYRINSDKIKRELGFEAKFKIEDAVMELMKAYKDGKIKDMNDSIYHNVKRMKEINLS